MSTRTAFTVVGTVIGAYFGNPALGATIGSMVGGYVDPVKVKGPRLTDAQQQTSQDGVPIPLTFGVVRIQGNIIVTGPLTEHKHKDDGKGSGTETTTYTYTRTYAIGICEGPIGGIRRVWKNGKLVMDATPPSEGADVHDRLAFFRFFDNHVLYLGDENQVVDGELEAAVGAGKIPAFRGLAYMVAVDEDVTDTAGAIPTFEFEVITTGSTYVQYEYVPVTFPQVMPWGLSPESVRDPRFTAGDYLYHVWTDPAEGWTSNFKDVMDEAIAFHDKDPMSNLPLVIGWSNIASNNDLGFSGPEFKPWRSSSKIDQSIYVNPADMNPVYLVIPRVTYDAANSYWAVGSAGAYYPCQEYAKNIWASAFTSNQPPGDMDRPGAQSFPSGVSKFSALDPGDKWDQVASCSSGQESVFMYQDYIIQAVAVPGCYQYIDPDWLLVPGTVDTYVDRYGEYHSRHDCVTVSGSYYQLAKLVLTPDGTSYTQAPLGPILETTSEQSTRAFWESAYDHAVAMLEMPAGLSYPADYPVVVTSACRCAIGSSVSEGDVSLAEIVSSLCFRAGLAPEEIDVSELTERVIGFTVATQTDAADAINVLAPGFFFDGSEWDGVTHFVKRGHDHVEVLTFDDSVETDDPRIKETRSQELELPATFVLSYFDPAADLAVTTQRASRRAVTVKATGQDQLQIAVAMTTNQAAQVADRLMKDKWASLAGTVSQTIPDEFSYLTPTDIVVVESDGAQFRVRLGPITSQDGTLNYEGTQDVQSAYTSDVEGLPPPTPVVGVDGPPSPTLALFFNLPALRDRDDQVGLYVAATGVVGRWPGALIEVSRDGGLTWTSTINILQSSTVGQLLTELPAWNPYVVDPEYTVDVRLTSGELASITMAQLFQQGNGAVIGEELLQYRTATLIGAGQYELAEMVRGRKNTDSIDHAVGENFALLSDLYFVPLSRSDIGANLKFRAVTLGTANSDGIVTDVAFTQAKSVTEWPVTNVRADRDIGTGDISLAWSPRHRLGNAANPYASLYFTGYVLTVSNGTTSKTYTTTAQTFAYTAAMQTADFGAPVDPLSFTIAATNSIIGAGDAYAGTV
jgi:hypothetical protein